MTTVDARARRAAHSIRAGVADFTPAATFDVVVVRHQRWRTIQAALAGAVSAAIIVIVSIMATPSPEAEVAETPVTVPTTIPTPEPEVVPPPIVIDTTLAPTTTITTSTTTTTTTAVPVPTTEPPDTTPPVLSITHPEPDQRFDVERIEFRGITEPGARVFAGQYEATVDREGNWAIVLILSPGANGARFVAADAAGNEAEARVTVHYDVPETTEPPREEPPPEEPPKDVIEFTAHNVYGSCEENPPYDVYWGTAPPGTPITVESEFGSGVTEANAQGDWEIRVYFPEAPFDTEFLVKVRDDKGNRKTFGMVRFG